MNVRLLVPTMLLLLVPTMLLLLVFLLDYKRTQSNSMHTTVVGLTVTRYAVTSGLQFKFQLFNLTSDFEGTRV